jgi:hypothetical protein
MIIIILLIIIYIYLCHIVPWLDQINHVFYQIRGQSYYRLYGFII